MIGSKLLVIDSDRGMCELIRTYFKNEGYDVVEANGYIPAFTPAA